MIYYLILSAKVPLLLSHTQLRLDHYRQKMNKSSLQSSSFFKYKLTFSRISVSDSMQDWQIKISKNGKILKSLYVKSLVNIMYAFRHTNIRQKMLTNNFFNKMIIRKHTPKAVLLRCTKKVHL